MESSQQSSETRAQSLVARQHTTSKPHGLESETHSRQPQKQARMGTAQNRLELTDAPMSPTTASKAGRAKATWRQEASSLRRRNLNQHALLLRWNLDMMKEIVLPPTVRRKDPIFHVQILLSETTPNPQRNCLTMRGGLLTVRSFVGSWAVWHARREVGSHMSTGMPSFLIEPRLFVLLHLFIG